MSGPHTGLWIMNHTLVQLARSAHFHAPRPSKGAWKLWKIMGSGFVEVVEAVEDGLNLLKTLRFNFHGKGVEAVEVTSTELPQTGVTSTVEHLPLLQVTPCKGLGFVLVVHRVESISAPRTRYGSRVNYISSEFINQTARQRPGTSYLNGKPARNTVKSGKMYGQALETPAKPHILWMQVPTSR